MKSMRENNNGDMVLQGRIHLIISAFLFLLLGLIVFTVFVGSIFEISDITITISLLLQSILLLGMSFVYYISRNNKNKTKLVIILSIIYSLVVLSNYFNVAGIGTWRFLSLLIPVNAIIGAYKNQKGVSLRK